VQIERKTEEGRSWQTQFKVQVDLGAGLTRREQIILFNSARSCEVNKLLNGEMAFDYQLVEGRVSS
jgi:hypothetical protein